MSVKKIDSKVVPAKAKLAPGNITLKQRFIGAIIKGELGHLEGGDVIVTLKEFKAYFSDIQSQYVNSFLPAATFEPGQFSLTKTKFVFRVRKGVYRVHSDLLVG